MRLPRLSKLELQIMDALWSRGASSVREIQEAFPEKGRPAYTTVQTMLNILVRKGKLTRKMRGRAFEYAAIVTEAKASSHAVRDLVDRMFGGSAEDLVMSLIKSRQIDPKKLAKLGKRLKEEERDA